MESASRVIRYPTERNLNVITCDPFVAGDKRRRTEENAQE